MKFSDVMAVYDYKLINLAKALRVSRDTVNLWKNTNSIPFKYQCMLEVMNEGKLKADKEKV